MHPSHGHPSFRFRARTRRPTNHHPSSSEPGYPQTCFRVSRNLWHLWPQWRHRRRHGRLRGHLAPGLCGRPTSILPLQKHIPVPPAYLPPNYLPSHVDLLTSTAVYVSIYSIDLLSSLNNNIYRIYYTLHIHRSIYVFVLLCIYSLHEYLATSSTYIPIYLSKYSIPINNHDICVYICIII